MEKFIQIKTNKNNFKTKKIAYNIIKVNTGYNMQKIIMAKHSD